MKIRSGFVSNSSSSSFIIGYKDDAILDIFKKGEEYSGETYIHYNGYHEVVLYMYIDLCTAQKRYIELLDKDPNEVLSTYAGCSYLVKDRLSYLKKEIEYNVRQIDKLGKYFGSEFTLAYAELGDYDKETSSSLSKMIAEGSVVMVVEEPYYDPQD